MLLGSAAKLRNRACELSNQLAHRRRDLRFDRECIADDPKVNVHGQAENQDFGDNFRPLTTEVLFQRYTRPALGVQLQPSNAKRVPRLSRSMSNASHTRVES